MLTKEGTVGTDQLAVESTPELFWLLVIQAHIFDFLGI